jgi:hypothetical protein
MVVAAYPELPPKISILFPLSILFPSLDMIREAHNLAQPQERSRSLALAASWGKPRTKSTRRICRPLITEKTRPLLGSSGGE